MAQELKEGFDSITRVKIQIESSQPTTLRPHGYQAKMEIRRKENKAEIRACRQKETENKKERKENASCNSLNANRKRAIAQAPTVGNNSSSSLARLYYPSLGTDRPIANSKEQGCVGFLQFLACVMCRPSCRAERPKRGGGNGKLGTFGCD